MADPKEAPERIDRLEANPFLDGPGEFLVKTVASQIRAVPQFKLIFGEAIDAYKRMDFGMRDLPAIRFYCNAVTKEHESWYITGDVLADVLWPPSIRRVETQQFPDTIAGALWQQFRRPSFFTTMEGLVPGLNEFGKRIAVDKSLGFLMPETDDEIIPLTQFTINFRLDLRRWDDHLEAQGRTKDDPFEITLANLETIAATIQAMRESGENDVAIESLVKV